MINDADDATLIPYRGMAPFYLESSYRTVGVARVGENDSGLRVPQVRNYRLI